MKGEDGGMTLEGNRGGRMTLEGIEEKGEAGRMALEG